MHEMALCESLLDSLREAARAHGFARVTKAVSYTHLTLPTKA